MIKLLNGDNIELLKTLEDNSIDSVVTDPPYGISFLNKKWDYDIPSVIFWNEVFRVLKPGGHILVACGTRTQHRMVVNIEDAGFEIRDIISYVYSTGFPKSMNIGKRVDEVLGNERVMLSELKTNSGGMAHISKTNAEQGFRPSAYTGNKEDKSAKNVIKVTKGTSDWEGWGTSLKPAMELWTLARKPVSEKTVVDNVLKYGTGGINIDESRVPYENNAEFQQLNSGRKSNRTIRKGDVAKNFGMSPEGYQNTEQSPLGRFPANVIHDGSEEVTSLFPDSKGAGGSVPQVKVTGYGDGIANGKIDYFGGDRIPMDSGDGSASRFFYCAKPSTKERDFGVAFNKESQVFDGQKTGNIHPTVKPIKLMNYLTKLITPKKGICLDPFMGSGTTGISCVINDFNFIGMEREKEYFDICKKRINYTIKNPKELLDLLNDEELKKEYSKSKSNALF